MVTVWHSSQIWKIREVSDRHTWLKIIPPHSYIAGSNNHEIVRVGREILRQKNTRLALWYLVAVFRLVVRLNQGNSPKPYINRNSRRFPTPAKYGAVAVSSIGRLFVCSLIYTTTSTGAVIFQFYILNVL